MAQKTKSTPRVSRSISFEARIYAHLLKRAKQERRSPNWMVNEFVRRDLNSDESAPVAAATTQTR